MQIIQIYDKTVAMWNKIFLIILAAAIILTGIFSFYSYSWLGSIGDPQTAVESYKNVSSLALVNLWISAIILLALANVVLWQTQRSWAMWLSFAYFAVFVILRYLWFDNALLSFEKTKGLTDSSISFSPFFGVIFVILAAVIVFFNQFLNLRLKEKMFPPIEPENDAEIAEEA